MPEDALNKLLLLLRKPSVYNTNIKNSDIKRPSDKRHDGSTLPGVVFFLQAYLKAIKRYHGSQQKSTEIQSSKIQIL